MAICSGCSREISGAAIQYTADAQIVCDACAGRQPAVRRSRPRWVKLAAIGAIAGAIPFFTFARVVKTERVDGMVTSFEYRDWIALAGGGLAILFGLLALRAAWGPAVRKRELLAGLAVIAIGGYQVAKGFGRFDPRSGVEAHLSGSLVAATAPAGGPSVAPAAVPANDPTKPETCSDKEACFALGRKLEEAKRVPGAITAYERACERGAAGGCFNAGLLAKLAATPDFEKSARMMKLGCDLKDNEACNQLGAAYRKGSGIAQDAQKAFSLFGQSCEDGNGNACSNVSSMYEAGEGMAVDVELAAAFAAKACDEDPSPSLADTCAHAGVLLFEGEGVKHDPARAVSYFTRACERAATTCHGLAVATAKGIGTRKNLPKARELYRTACDAGNLASCNNLGDLERRGLGGPKDLADARLLFKRACDGEVDVACSNLK